MWLQQDREVRRHQPQRDGRWHSRKAWRRLLGGVGTGEATPCPSLGTHGPNCSPSLGPRALSHRRPHVRRPVRRRDDLHLLCPCCMRDANIHRLLVVSMYSHDSPDGWLVTSTLQMRKGSLGRKDVERSPKASRCSTGLEEPNGPGEQSVRARGRGCPGRGHTGTEKRPE